MSTALEKRVRTLERQVAKLVGANGANLGTGREWVDDLYGKFEGDPVFAEAMELGRKYRQSLRLPARKSRSRK